MRNHSFSLSLSLSSNDYDYHECATSLYIAACVLSLIGVSLTKIAVNGAWEKSLAARSDAITEHEGSETTLESEVH